MMKNYNSGLYLRLSKEDNEENNSIDIQREITTKYAQEHGYNIVEEYIDNGYSGMLSSRPALDKMIMDIVRNKINMVIVKDMSRLTRDKNMTSYYTDILFPDNDVRLISVTEFVDTGERYEIDDVVALRGIVNQCYVEDISKKIKAVKRNFKEQGKFIESSVAYGYKKDDNDPHKIVIDKNVEHIIRDIYNWYLEGKQPSEIADELNKRNIMTASQYMGMKNVGKKWSSSMVNRILTSPIYAGNMVLNKYVSNLQLKKMIHTTVGNYEILNNTHSAIISQEDFERVQKKKNSRIKNKKREYYFLLKELTFCKHCGRRMTYKNPNPMIIDKNGLAVGKQNDKGYFICEQHNRNKDICNAFNKIMEKYLNVVVLKKLSRRLRYLQIHKFAKDIKDLKERQNTGLNDLKKMKNEISRHEASVRVLYSKKVEGIITEKEFKEKYNNYTEKVTKLKEKIDRYEISEETYNLRNSVDKLIIEFENCNNFDNTILKKLIEKIEISKNNDIEITFKI